MVSLRSLVGDDAEMLREADVRLLPLANVQAPLGRRCSRPCSTR
jgi:hypothetical protein